MVLVKDTNNSRIRGVHHDGEVSVTDRVDEEGGVGNGVLHLGDCLQHLRGDGELPRVVDREPVRGQTLWARQGRKWQ